RIRTDWPANALISTERVVNVASSLAVLPSSSITFNVVAPTTSTRKKSSTDETVGGDRNEVKFGGPDSRRRGLREHRHCPRCFRSSPYRPMATDGPRPLSRRTSLVDTPMRGRDQASEAQGGVGTLRATMFYAILSGPDEVTSRAPVP